MTKPARTTKSVSKRSGVRSGKGAAPYTGDFASEIRGALPVPRADRLPRAKKASTDKVPARHASARSNALAPPDNGVPEPSDPFFQRRHVELALWRLVAAAPDEPFSGNFQTRIKHLLESDRQAGQQPGAPGPAFTDTLPTTRGDHATFSAYDVILLWLALQLVDLGFKRQEVVALMRSLRDPLRAAVSALIALRFRELNAGVRPFTQFDPREPENRLFLLLARIEARPDYINGEREDAWLPYGATLLRGLKKLSAKMQDRAMEKVIIVELAAAAYALPPILARAFIET